MNESCVICGHANSSHRVDGSCRSRVYARTVECSCTSEPGSARPRKHPSLLERLNSRTSEPTASGCREWTGQKNPKGYGILFHAGGKRAAHRLLFEATNGPIPSGQWIDHMCGNRSCVALEHLRAVTPSENGHHRTQMSSRNTSGFPGVVWAKQQGMWQANAGHLGRNHFLGRFAQKEDAYLAYVRFALIHFTHADPAMLSMTPDAAALVVASSVPA